MRTAVVIVTYNGTSLIDQCITSVTEDPLGPHVIVVDNASTDDTVVAIRAKHPTVELIAHPVNAGFGRANNIGIARAIDQGADAVLLLNQDAYLPPGSLVQLVRFLEQHQEYGAATPLHCSPDAEHVDRKTLRGYLVRNEHELLCDALLSKTSAFYSIKGVNAAIWLVRTSAFRRVGGFDPLFFMYGEDDDLLARFEHHGVRFALLPHVKAVHLRQPAPRAGRTTFWQKLRRQEMLERAWLLAAMKRPANSLAHMVLLLFAHGIVEAVRDLLLTRNWIDFFAKLLAVVRLGFAVPVVLRHSRRCSRPGPHFLPGLSAPSSAPSSNATRAERTTASR